jgi:alkylation response protein AidB-like acyl-CoA dehydrogenase
MKLASLFRFRRRNDRAHGGKQRREVDALAKSLRKLKKDGALDLAPVGRGQTAERHAALYEFGRTDLSLARVVEAHTDATAILAESSVTPRDHALYGVWAADGPDSQLYLETRPDGRLALNGTKRYCSGSTFLDAALVTAHQGADLMLVDVSLNAKGISVDTSSWASPAMSATATGTVEFEHVEIEPSQLIGPPGWYLQRPGFWHGALGPAACWAGGAAGLVDAARNAARTNPHYLAHLGAMEAAAWVMSAILDRAGREIDEDPLDTNERARFRALSARHLIERLCTDVMDHFGRATGPALLALDASIARRYAELTLYIRQSHAERDLEAMMR